MPWLNPLVISCCVGVVLLTGQVVRPQRLEERLTLVRRGLMFFAPLSLILAVSVALATRLPRPVFVGDGEEAQAIEWLAAAREAHEQVGLAFGGLLFTLGFMGVQVMVLLGDLRNFVSTQRLDLAARDAVRLNANE